MTDRSNHIVKGECKMKKLTKLLAVTMTGGLLLAGCMDAEDVDENDLPAVEDPLDEDVEEDTGVMEDDPEEELDEDTDE